MDRDEQRTQDSAGPPIPKPKLWTRPEVADLPKLTDLTLLTGSPIGGTGGTGGSTVF